MTEGVSAMHQTSMAWRHLHRKDDIWPIVKTHWGKQLGKESNFNSQNWKRKCENKKWNHGIDTAYSGYRGVEGNLRDRRSGNALPVRCASAACRRWTGAWPPTGSSSGEGCSARRKGRSASARTGLTHLRSRGSATACGSSSSPGDRRRDRGPGRCCTCKHASCHVCWTLTSNARLKHCRYWMWM